ncbi:hypothetical protein OKA05_25005 [Luteolibacter arcticus]|uniref:Uncharacterized protein n=1 Tax=Luteolibacter arcticus TaxID=1581411 RepID=A0ABT3GQP1_9BACT|nr:hypothetical protein [Luteolibacter arcticus]MCW1925842.1 hypothetical protein [Luteolibacter arcticus]
MKFFIPSVEDPDQAQLLHQVLANACSQKFGISVTPARVFALRYRCEDHEYLAQVGIPHPPGPEAHEVVAIFPSPQVYLICMRGEVTASYRWRVIARNAISDAEYFNEIDDQIPEPE